LHLTITANNNNITANNTNIFKRRLDAYWQDQDTVYDVRAHLQGTGSRSEVFRYE